MTQFDIKLIDNELRDYIESLTYEIRESNTSSLSSLYSAEWGIMVDDIREIISPLLHSIAAFGSFAAGVDYTAKIFLSTEEYKRIRDFIVEEFSLYNIRISLKRVENFIQKITDHIISSIKKLTKQE